VAGVYQQVETGGILFCGKHTHKAYSESLWSRGAGLRNSKMLKLQAYNVTFVQIGNPFYFVVLHGRHRWSWMAHGQWKTNGSVGQRTAHNRL